MGNYFIGIFETPFLHIKVKNWEEKKKQLKDLLGDQKLIHIKEDNIITDYHTSKNKYTEDLSKILKSELVEIYNAFNLNHYFISDCWFETAKNKMDHRVHNHGAIGLSAVCFVDYDSRYHTPTKFISNHCTIEHTDIGRFVPPNVEEGSLIVFPSCVLHYTSPNTSEVDRTILAFNMNKKSEHMYN